MTVDHNNILLTTSVIELSIRVKSMICLQLFKKVTFNGNHHKLKSTIKSNLKYRKKPPGNPFSCGSELNITAGPFLGQQAGQLNGINASMLVCLH